MRNKLILLAFIAMGLLAMIAYAGIEVKPEYENHEPIVATLKADLPEGAQVRGSWKVEGGKFLPAGKNAIHVWAPPGKHLIIASGVWVLTKDVKIGNQTVPVLIDFGQYEYEQGIIVRGGGPEPGPQPGPEPGPVPEDRWILILEETKDRNPEVTRKLALLQEALAGEAMLIVDKDNASSRVQAVIAQAPNIQLPAFFVVSSAGDKVVYKGPLPTPDEAKRILGGK